MENFQSGNRPAWDPESTFAKPPSKPPKALSAITQARSKIQSWTSSRPFLKKGSPPTNQGTGSGAPTPPSTAKVSTADTAEQALPHTPKGGATNSTSSSTVLRPEQQAAPRNPLVISKFSWTTPRTDTSAGVSSSQTESVRRSYVSKESHGDGGTVYTSDSEPPRFRSVFSWVQHQQTKTLKRNGQSPDDGVSARV